EAQKRTEQRVEELAEAQKRTEQGVEELAEAQKRTEQRVEELAEAQKRTEQRVEELAEAQKRTEQRVEELAEAQKRTEKRIDVLTERVEGISNTFGYALENIVYKSLPSLLFKEDNIKVQGKIIRRYYERQGSYNQINLYARIIKDGKEMLMLGEVKTRPSKLEIDRFLKIAEYIKKREGSPEVYLVFVAHDYHPRVENYLKEKGIRYFWSYDVENQ
ncbi:MAG: hypothetical protein N3A62_07115, partial [Thermodesulfovibrionales bacterium]|nr:hypothetical protein [Thermodesulfovibrionales bacterium]